MSKLDKFIEQVRDSEAFQQVKVKYDELDGQAKLYINLGAVAAIVLFIFLTILIGITKLNTLKSEINEREELIGYLERSADTIKQSKAQQASTRGSTDVSSPLPEFIEGLLQTTGLDRAKVEIGGEKPGTEDKEAKEFLTEVKLNQVNIKQLTRFMFTLTEQGSARSINIKDLNVDTKDDPNGYLEATMTVASYKAK